MKKITFLISLCFVLMCTANAQEQRRRPTNIRTADRMVNRIERVITLTNLQEDQLANVFATSLQNLQNIRENYKGNEKEMKEAMLKNKLETDLAVQKILSPEQYQRYVEWNQKHLKHKKEHLDKSRRKHSSNKSMRNR